MHGDDYTTLDIDTDLDWYENQLKHSVEITIRWRLELGCTTPKEIRILDRIVSVNEQGLT